MYIYVHIYVCVYTYIYKRYTQCQEILLLGSEIQALSCAGVWTESSARLSRGMSITSFSATAQTVTIVSNVGAAHTRLPQRKHTHSGAVTDVVKSFLSLSETSKPFFLQDSGLSPRPALFLTRAALTSVFLHSQSQLSIMTALCTLRHTRMPSCKHTHNAQSLAVPRACLGRERVPSLELCGSLD